MTSTLVLPAGLADDAARAAEWIRWAEASSVPLFFPGLVKAWAAIERWQGPEGMRHLRTMAGGADVQVMLSSSAAFYGDISRHQPATVSFQQLLDLLLQQQHQPKEQREPRAQPCAARGASGTVWREECGHGDMNGSMGGRDKGNAGDRITGDGVSEASSGASSRLSEGNSSRGTASGDGTTRSGTSGSRGGEGEGICTATASSSSGDSDGPGGAGGQGGAAHAAKEKSPAADGAGSSERAIGLLHVYLAQQPLSGGLAPLLADIPTPACLCGTTVATTNLWVCGGSVRSSLHYDPHHNLLAMVSGRKVVTLVPPYMTLSVYPMSITGDAPNHSRVQFAEPDPAAIHPAYREAQRTAQRVELQAGDALFIPEGWWHQVDSGPDITIAVNYWWRSALTEALTAPPPRLPPPPPLSLPSAEHRPGGPPAHGVTAAGSALEGARHSETGKAGGEEGLPFAGSERMQATRAPASGSLRGPHEPLVLPGEGLEPGPGLRNLFALRQLARAAVEDVAEQLLAAVTPAGPPPQSAAVVLPGDLIAPAPKGPQDRLGSRSLLHLGDGETPAGQSPGTATQTVPVLAPRAAAAVLQAAVRACRTALGPAVQPSGPGGFIAAGTVVREAVGCVPRPPAGREEAAASATAGASAATAAAEGSLAAPPAPPPLSPCAAGLLCLLRPGEAAELGITVCPVASVLAALPAQSLAAALYDMCDRCPDVVSELLTRCSRTPTVACLLTRAFDRLGSQEALEQDGDGGDADRPIKRQKRDNGLGGTPTLYQGSAGVADDGAFRGDGGDPMSLAAGAPGGPACGIGDGNGSTKAAGEAGENDPKRVPNDFFERLYGTVEDPDEVFQLLLRGRAALNAVARRVLLESVLA